MQCWFFITSKQIPGTLSQAYKSMVRYQDFMQGWLVITNPKNTGP
jgi:hypothetical protein